MPLKAIYSLIATIISLTAYIPYITDILKGKTKPHIFSWLVWTISVGIAFFSQVVGGAGIGSWLLGFTTAVHVLITILSIKKGTKDIKLIDGISMAGSLIALIFWYITKSPFLSVIIITFSDLLGSLPTLRKTYNNPYHETISFYLLNVIKVSLGIMALEKYSIITTLFPAYLTLMNFVIFLTIYIRRMQLNKSK